MSEKYQKRVLEDMMKRPIPRKWIGIVKLQMVREGKVLYGTRRFTSAVDACLLYTSLIYLEYNSHMDFSYGCYIF